MKQYLALRAATLAILITAASFPLSAHEGATGIVKERMDAMEQMGKATKAMPAQLKANEMTQVKMAALAIQASAARIPSWFPPPGEDRQMTDAKPAIWDRPDDFAEKAKQLEVEGGKLAAATETGDPAMVVAQLRVLGRACSACHDTYRVKRKPGEPSMHMHDDR